MTPAIPNVIRELRPQLLWLVPFCGAVAPTTVWLYKRLTANVWQMGPGVFVPFIFVYFVYTYLRDDPERGAESSPLGFAFLVPGLLAIGLDAAIDTELLAVVGLVACVPGLSLLLLGLRRTRALAFPLLLLFMVIPIPAGLISPVYLVLRHISAWGAELAMGPFGIPAARDGTALSIPSGTYIVADVCSGFQTLMATVTLALILAYLSTSTRRRAAILLIAAPLAIATNMVRVTSLVLLGHTYGLAILDTYVHELSGLLAFGASLVLLFAVAGREAPRGAPA